MKPLPQKGAGAIGAHATSAVHGANPFALHALVLSRSLPAATADAALAILAYAANQAIAGQITLAHLVGDLAHAQAHELSTAGAQAVPKGVLRDALVSVANIEERFADDLIDSANRYGRTFAHLAFAFPIPSHAAR